MKLFFDANVIFSTAHRPDGRAQELLALARAGRCEIVTSTYALEEARRNLALKSARFEERLVAALTVIAIVAEASRELVTWAAEQELPAKDAPILAVAVNAGADLLVTGDAGDFGHRYGRMLRGVRVVAPARALDLVLKEAGA